MRKIADDWSWFGVTGKQIEPCQSTEHNPPTHIVLEPGTYEHQCPICANKQIVMVPWSWKNNLHPTEQPAAFITGIRYYAGMLEDDDNWSHSLGHIQELCVEFQAAIDARRKPTPTASQEMRAPITPRLPVGPFRPHLVIRPILLKAGSAALGQLRDLVASLGNWYDFAAFNEIVAPGPCRRCHGDGYDQCMCDTSSEATGGEPNG